MNERYLKRYVPWLGREFEMFVFGHDWNYWQDMLPYYLPML